MLREMSNLTSARQLCTSTVFSKMNLFSKIKTSTSIIKRAHCLRYYHLIVVSDVIKRLMPVYLILPGSFRGVSTALRLGPTQLCTQRKKKITLISCKVGDNLPDIFSKISYFHFKGKVAKILYIKI